MYTNINTQTHLYTHTHILVDSFGIANQQPPVTSSPLSLTTNSTTTADTYATTTAAATVAHTNWMLFLL